MNLGSLIRRHRKDRGLTLKAVAQASGVSEGFLSQVENNVKSPSVETLVNICQALEVNVGDVMNRAQEHQRLYVISRDDWRDVELPHTGFATRRFCPPEERTVIDTAVLIMEPGKSIPVRKDLKNGQEVLSVLEGRVVLVHPERNVPLGRGDSIHLWSEPKGQEVTNPGPDRAVVLWVGTV